MCSTNALRKLIVISTTQALIFFVDYITYNFLGAELLYAPPVFQDPCIIVGYWQLTGILKNSVPNNLLKKYIKTTLSYSFRQKYDCVMLYYIETVSQVNLAEHHIHQIWQALPISRGCLSGTLVGGN
jgi:hypothetical protein